MIRGIHGMFYSTAADELRHFIKEKLQFPFTDTGGGWLIFALPEGDLGAHPTDDLEGPPSGTHDISFYCDDIEETVRELEERGVEFEDEISDRGYGYVTHFTMPGDVVVQLYEPRYEKVAVRKPRKAAVRKKATVRRAHRRTAKKAKVRASKR